MTHSVKRYTLRPGGWLYLVGRLRRSGGTFARRIEEAFGGVEEIEKQSGYRVYRARRGEGRGHG
ncbi:MAG TPA: hypothetical protein VM221_14310 [Armatimonadota bacterium]|nr:hypothetical protein [Armatimonadota bacterium]